LFANKDYRYFVCGDDEACALADFCAALEYGLVELRAPRV
jgi:hypothetical protein